MTTITQLSKLSMTKPQLVISKYLNKEGVSGLIKRCDVPDAIKWTSGDGVFRNDSSLGKKYKFFRFSKKLNFNNQTSRCWDLTEEDKKRIQDIHKTLEFYRTGTCYIQFFGEGLQIIDNGIRADIRKYVCQSRCAHCGMTDNIECDHKNDLKNDPRVLNTRTQTIDDFQPLCGRCNKYKRSFLTKLKQTGNRQSAIELGYMIDFTIGDETLDKNDPMWYIGTYWGDCLAFKNKLTM